MKKKTLIAMFCSGLSVFAGAQAPEPIATLFPNAKGAVRIVAVTTENNSGFSLAGNDSTIYFLNKDGLVEQESNDNSTNPKQDYQYTNGKITRERYWGASVFDSIKKVSYLHREMLDRTSYYEYDAHGRRIRERKTKGAEDKPVEETVYTYDQKGRLVQELTTRSYIPNNTFSKIIRKDYSYQDNKVTIRTFYDDKENLTSIRTLRKDGLMLAERTQTSKGELLYEAHFTYNNHKQPISWVASGPDLDQNKPQQNCLRITKTIYTYDEKGRMATGSYYDGDFLCSKRAFIYIYP